jgi:hypothetical protein
MPSLPMSALIAYTGTTLLGFYVEMYQYAVKRTATSMNGFVNGLLIRLHHMFIRKQG